MNSSVRSVSTVLAECPAASSNDARHAGHDPVVTNSLGRGGPQCTDHARAHRLPHASLQAIDTNEPSHLAWWVCNVATQRRALAGLLPTACSDLEYDCASWAASGECSDNRDFMLRRCAQSYSTGTRHYHRAEAASGAQSAATLADAGVAHLALFGIDGRPCPLALPSRLSNTLSSALLVCLKRCK